MLDVAGHPELLEAVREILGLESTPDVTLQGVEFDPGVCALASLQVAGAGEVVLELSDVQQGHAAWTSGARLALGYRRLPDGSSAFEVPGLAAALEQIAAEFRSRCRRAEVERAAELLLSAVQQAAELGAEPTTPESSGAREPWQRAFSHYHSGECSGPESDVVVAALELGVFDRLRATAGLSVRQVAKEAGCDPAGLGLLLHALAAMGFVEDTGDGDRFRILPDPARALADKWNLLAWRVEEASRWRRLADRIRQGSVDDWVMGEERAGRWLRAIGEAQDGTIAEEVDGLPLEGVRRLLDVGSGAGRYAAEILRAFPSIELTLVDYPQCIGVTREHVDKSAAGARVRYEVARFFEDDWQPPSGHDAAWLSGVLHATDAQTALSLLRRLHDALEPQGRLFVDEQIADDGSIRKRMNELNYFLMAQRARSYRQDELFELLREAGFSGIEPVSSTDWAVVISARKS